MQRATTWLGALAVFSSAQAQNIIAGEYWIDQDNGFGSPLNHALAITPTSNVTDTTYTVDLTGLAPGTHTIGIRTLDDSARWSLTNFTPVLITELPPLSNIVQVEYFLNQDPYFGGGDTAWLGSDPDTAGISFTADLSNAVPGTNTLFIRSRTADGKWSLTNHTPVLITVPDTAGVIDRIETFVLPGPDPGFGSADQYVVPSPGTDLMNELFNAPVPVDFVPGDTLMIRSHDSRGSWSLTNHVQVSEWTDVEHLANSTGISVFPNPFTDAFTVQPADAQPLRVILYDPQGKLVHDEVLTTSKRIDLSGLSNGAYTVFFWKDLERIHRVTLIKQ